VVLLARLRLGWVDPDSEPAPVRASPDPSRATLDAVRKIVETTTFVLRGRDRVREEIRERSHQGSKDHPLPVTVSAGVAEKMNDATTISMVLKAAYRALYEAKSTGGTVVRRAIATAEPVRRPSGTFGRIVASGENP